MTSELEVRITAYSTSTNLKNYSLTLNVWLCWSGSHFLFFDISFVDFKIGSQSLPQLIDSIGRSLDY